MTPPDKASGPTADLFGGPVQHECKACAGIHDSPDEVRLCVEEHEREGRRERARRFARTGKRSGT